MALQNLSAKSRVPFHEGGILDMKCSRWVKKSPSRPCPTLSYKTNMKITSGHESLSRNISTHVSAAFWMNESSASFAIFSLWHSITFGEPNGSNIWARKSWYTNSKFPFFIKALPQHFPMTDEESSSFSSGLRMRSTNERNTPRNTLVPRTQIDFFFEMESKSRLENDSIWQPMSRGRNLHPVRMLWSWKGVSGPTQSPLHLE